MYNRTASILVLVCAVALTSVGCSSSRDVASVDDTKDIEYYIDNIDQYEDFDETSYVDPPPVTGEVIDHDVPPELMAGSATSGSRTYETVDGFRIQIHSSLDKEGAVASEERAKEWWQTLEATEKPSSMAGGSLPIYLKYVQPYYRVRVGNFGTREEAEIALQVVSARFPRAFIVVDRVTVLR